MRRRSTAKTFSALLEAEASFDRSALTKLYGEIPAWVPEPIVLRITQAIAILRNSGQDLARIQLIVTGARNDNLTIPAVQDPIAFITSANYLAHVQWALTLDRPRAIKELAGTRAASAADLSQRRGQISGKANAAKKALAAEKRLRWLKIGQSLRKKHPEKSDMWLAQQIARECDDNVSTIRNAIRTLGLKKQS